MMFRSPSQFFTIPVGFFPDPNPVPKDSQIILNLSLGLCKNCGNLAFWGKKMFSLFSQDM